MNITIHQETKQLFDRVHFDGVLKCVHCGLCLDACPTYRETGLEQDSPRGRLYLMGGMAKGELALSPEVITPLDRCLDCRACETACPSNVPYGELLEKTRGIIRKNQPASLKEKIVRFVFLENLLLAENTLILLSKILKAYRYSGGVKLITQSVLKKILPDAIVRAQFLMPDFSGRSFKRRYKGQTLFPFTKQQALHRVAIFSGCITDVAEAKTHEATLQLLRATGNEVVIPKEQICCGALHVHSGERKTSRGLAKQNKIVFADSKVDSIITNSAGCSAQLKEYHLLFHHTEKTKWHSFENKVCDIMEYLARFPKALQSLQWKTEPETVLYDAPCHLMHAQNVDKNPRRVLSQIPGVKLLPIDEADRCCGSAGIYNLLNGNLADDILKRKISSIERSLKKHPEATTLVTGNPGCLFQIRFGIQSAALPLQVLHPAVYMASRLKNNQ